MNETQNHAAAFALKLLKAKSEIKAIGFDKDTDVGGGRKAKYVSLDKIYNKLTPILSANALVMTMENTLVRGARTAYTPVPEGVTNDSLLTNLGYIYELMVTIIDAETGYRETYTYQAIYNQPQGRDLIKSYGSVMTYMQRYACDMLFSLQSSEKDPDDNIDDNTPPSSQKSNSGAVKGTGGAVKYVGKGEYVAHYNKYKGKLTDEEQLAVMNSLGISSWTQIPVNVKDALVDALDQTLKSKQAQQNG